MTDQTGALLVRDHCRRNLTDDRRSFQPRRFSIFAYFLHPLTRVLYRGKMFFQREENSTELKIVHDRMDGIRNSIFLQSLTNRLRLDRFEEDYIYR